MKYRKYVLALLLGVLSVSVQAVSVKGVGSVEYKGMFGPGKSDSRMAYDLASYNAIERYVSKGGRSKIKLLDKHQEVVRGRLDDLLLDVTVVDTQKNKSLKKLKLVVRATLNVSLLDIIFTEQSGFSSDSGGDDFLTFVFVAREQKSIKRYEDRKLQRAEKTLFKSGLDNEVGDEGYAEYSSKNKQIKQMEVGGSVTRKADVIEYDVTTVNEINAMMSSVFTASNFEVVEIEYLESETNGLVDADTFKRDFGKGDDINSRTLSNTVKGLKLLDVPYLALGTMDVGLHDIDKATGLTRVYVTVTGKVISLKKRFPRTVASTGPVQFSGLGPNPSVAKTNALKLAAEQTAVTLTEQLRSK